jgi:biopolymer transport protein ExbD
MQLSESSVSALGGGGLVPPRAKQEDPAFDVTAMVDVVSLMNIYYFMVTFVGIALTEANLPPASHGRALDADTSTVITVVVGRGWQSVDVFLGDKEKGTPITDEEEQQEQIAQAVTSAIAKGKTDVLIKADKTVRLRDMQRVARAATQEGASLHFAVMERRK